MAEDVKSDFPILADYKAKRSVWGFGQSGWILKRNLLVYVIKIWNVV